MRIMSLNSWGGTLWDSLLPYLRDESPDVLCLQEVVHSPASPRDWLIYRDGDHVLDQRANLLRDVTGALPDHVPLFCPAARGTLWDGDDPVPSFWGLATFVHRDLPIVGQVQGFVHKGFEANGFGEHPRSRSGHAVRVWDDRLDRGVSIAQMHGLRDLAGKMDTPERAVQARRFLGLLRAVAEPGDATVLCGDFNVEPGSETLSYLADEGFDELVTGGGHPTTRTSHYPKPGRFADYMLVGPDTRPAAFEVVRDPEVSDHCPLVLTL
ncbi:exonuclease III [Maritimibacter alkaliphilus HTCC2654]|uniref:Endonuclease/exonuclease/phosphatase domain-containing protein n=2 Tax=Maritimibacter TaxID=404235 RepID=A3VFM6_9RHOB|nr:hypothetical protein RB2654_11603 [Rhodobacterales bacterium HTCC2654] [Maritimibacter alkaliphilus HTCC2654]TYP78862.1 exonuclease III [Maritimibacter alkaliphilus HTCC2654]